MPDTGPPVRAVLPEPLLVTSFDRKRVSRTGVAVTVLVHVLVIVIAMLEPVKPPQPNAAASSAVTYIAPRQRQRDAKVEAAPAPAPPRKPAPVKPRPAARPEVVKVERLPDTITLPEERVVQAPREEPPKPAEIAKVDPAMDMGEMVAARRRARLRESGIEEQETEAQRADRIARANIESANRAGSAAKPGTDTWRLVIHSPFSATWHYRRDKSRFPSHIEVELGSEKDIETAAVKTQLRFLRAEFGAVTGWKVGSNTVILSLRPQDTQATEDFLFRQGFPGYQRRP